MKKVWRFVLAEFGDEALIEDAKVDVSIEVPKGTEMFGDPTGTSKGLVLYGLVPDDAEEGVGEQETRSFVLVKNGVPLPEGVGSINFRGTFKIPGSITLHVFETTQVLA